MKLYGERREVPEATLRSPAYDPTTNSLVYFTMEFSPPTRSPEKESDWNVEAQEKPQGGAAIYGPQATFYDYCIELRLGDNCGEFTLESVKALGHRLCEAVEDIEQMQSARAMEWELRGRELGLLGQIETQRGKLKERIAGLNSEVFRLEDIGERLDGLKDEEDDW